MTHNDELSLRLQFPPSPEFAAQHAQIAVDAAINVTGIALDYSPKSLKDVDAIIGGFHLEGLTANQIGETVFTFGCYAGEVFVRHNSGVWKMPSEIDLPAALSDDNNMMLLALPNDVVCNPIGKAFKLLEQGEGESLAYFHQVFSRESAGG